MNSKSWFLPINRYWLVHVSAILLVLGCAAHSYLGYFHYDWSGDAWGTDDAYISYRYAKNFAEGHGLVFNPGDRVEGYSNLLYVLVLTPVFLLGAAKNIYLVSVVLNIVFAVVGLYVFARYAYARFGYVNGSLAALLFALTPPLWVWVGSGMETVLVLLLTLLILVTIEQVAYDYTNKAVLFSVLIVAIIMSRADGFIIAAIAIAYVVIRGRYKIALWSSITFVGTMVLYSAWRLSYYGDLLPNTYYAKVSGPFVERVFFAIRQLWGIAMNEGLFVYLLTFIFVVAQLIIGYRRVGQGERNQLYGFDTVFVPLWLAYWIYIGADHFVERFLVVLYPLGIVMFFRHIAPELKTYGRIFIISLFVVLQLRMVVLDDRFIYTFEKYDRNIELGRYLGENYKGALLAVEAAGKIPYYSGLKTIDMLGLNDRYIARTQTTFFEVGHNKYDADYVLALCPDLIVNWVHDSDMNLVRGITREKYDGMYRWAYLLNASREPAKDNIIEVRGDKLSDLQELLDQEYTIAVLEKVECSINSS
ncbi:MAG TPA: hypothetical protein DGN60_04930 [Chloroflexi bacterium]|nr:hypothetical protein [Chloroflexota bacterium]